MTRDVTTNHYILFNYYKLTVKWTHGLAGGKGIFTYTGVDECRIVWPRTFWPRFSAGEDSLAIPGNILYSKQLQDKHIKNEQIFKLSMFTFGINQ